MSKLKVGVEKIDRIYHISDIHIRNFKRHKEYREVFESIRDYINKTKTKESIICLTGDIVHSKTDITPELVQEVTYLLTILSQELPVVLIPGNHDTNLNNNNRLDSLSPIVNAIRNPNIIYLKDSGVFEMANVVFYHWSVFDKPENFPKVVKKPGKVSICLYHGAVKPFNFSGGFEYSNSSLESTAFSDFDITLLGDLHEAHFVDEAKTAGYPGSTIQQNHGEGLNHGFLVWDVNTKSSEFVKVKNNTAYYTIDVDSGLYEPIPSDVADKLYLRVRYKNTDYSVIKSIISSIKSEKEVIEVSEQKINTFEKGDYKQNRRMMPDVTDIQQQNMLLSDFLKKKYSLGDEDIAFLCKLNDGLNKEVKLVETNRNINWSPRKFEFSNMFSYGENNIIDFQNMSGTYGIFAPNASGKSSLLSALEYCIFDKCSKTSKAGQVMNNNSSTFHCRFEFELNGLVHVIERKAKKSKTDTVKVDVDFFYYDEQGTVVSLNGKERSDTNSKIRELLGSYEDFVLTCMSIQGNNTGFIDMGQADRKSLLVQFLDISIFDSLYDLANNKVKELSVLVKEYKKTDYEAEIQNHKSTSEFSNEELQKLFENKIAVHSLLESLIHRQNQLKMGLVNIESDSLNIADLEAKKVSLVELISKEESSITSTKESIVELEVKISGLKEQISSIDEEAIKKGLLELSQMTSEERLLTGEVERKKANMLSMLDKMKKLEDLKYDESCKFCMDNVFVKDAIKTKGLIQDAEEEARTIVQKLRDLRNNIAEYDKVKEKKVELEDFQRKLLKEETLKVSLEGSINSKNSSILRLKKDLDSINESITKYHENLISIVKNKEIREKIDELNREIQRIKSNMTSIESKISQLHGIVMFSKRTIESLEQSIEKLKSLEEQFRYYNYYLTAVSKDGVPHYIMSSVIPIIEEDINNILSQVVEFKIEIKTDGKNINAYILYDDSRTWPIELASGMEKFISSLAIRTALINISSLPRPSFLAIDEGFGVLDIDNISNISILMDYLKTQFKFILMISHIDSIKDVVDKQIEVVRSKSGSSKVQYT